MLSITPSGRSRRPRRGVEPRSRGSEPLVLSVIPTGQVADTVLMPSRGVEPRSPHFQYGAFPLSYNGFLRRASGSAQESNLDLEVRILPGFRYPNRAAANFYEPGGRTRSKCLRGTYASVTPIRKDSPWSRTRPTPSQMAHATDTPANRGRCTISAPPGI